MLTSDRHEPDSQLPLAPRQPERRGLPAVPATKAANPDRTFGDDISEASRTVRPVLRAGGIVAQDEDPLPSLDGRRLRMTGSRHRSFSVTHPGPGRAIARLGYRGWPATLELIRKVRALSPSRIPATLKEEESANLVSTSADTMLVRASPKS